MGVSDARLIADGLTCRRGSRLLFTGLDFSVGPGEILSLVGPNGTGKTSLLRILAGLLRPDTGTVRYGETLHFAGALHYLAHADAAKGALTVLENTTFWRDYYRGSVDPLDALERVDMLPLADLPASVLSAGQRRRLAVARLLVARRRIWLMDEPTAALDTASEAKLGALMAGHIAEGGMIVVATHMALPVSVTTTLDVSAFREPVHA